MSKIVLKGGEHVIRDEGVAAGAITPGMLLRRSSATAVAFHATAGGNHQKMFALENDLVGGGVSDAYAADDQVQIGHARSGVKIDALLKTGNNVAVGAALESAGDGTLQALTVVNTDDSDVDLVSSPIVGFAREAVNNSSGSAVRITIEVA